MAMQSIMTKLLSISKQTNLCFYTNGQQSTNNYISSG